MHICNFVEKKEKKDNYIVTNRTGGVFGEMAERLKAAVLKTVVPQKHRGFESPSLRFLEKSVEKNCWKRRNKILFFFMLILLTIMKLR